LQQKYFSEIQADIERVSSEIDVEFIYTDSDGKTEHKNYSLPYPENIASQDAGCIATANDRRRCK
jgi:hypothetical protein